MQSLASRNSPKANWPPEGKIAAGLVARDSSEQLGVLRSPRCSAQSERSLQPRADAGEDHLDLGPGAPPQRSEVPIAVESMRVGLADTSVHRRIAPICRNVAAVSAYRPDAALTSGCRHKQALGHEDPDQRAGEPLRTNNREVHSQRPRVWWGRASSTTCLTMSA